MNRIGKKYIYNFINIDKNPEYFFLKKYNNQTVTILFITIKGQGNTLEERTENGEPRLYKAKFEDGFEYDVFEDELTSLEKYALIHYKHGLLGEDLTEINVSSLMSEYGGVFITIPMNEYKKEKIDTYLQLLNSI